MREERIGKWKNTHRKPDVYFFLSFFTSHVEISMYLLLLREVANLENRAVYRYFIGDMGFYMACNMQNCSLIL